MDIVEKFDKMVDILMRRRRRHQSYAQVFGTPEGQLVLEDILKNGFATETTFVRGDPEQTILNEGSRRLALSILKMAKTNHSDRIREIEKQLQEQGIQL